MSLLGGKKILICRSVEQSRELKLRLERRRAMVTIFPTFQIVQIEHSDQIQSFRRTTAAFDDFEWIMLSSQNGVRFWAEWLTKSSIDRPNLVAKKLGVVGLKTKTAVREYWPDWEPILVATNAAELIAMIAGKACDRRIHLLHPTSVQSSENLPIELPENIRRTVLPIYRTVPNEQLSIQELEQITSGHYEVVIFSSPSSFDCLVALVGREVLANCHRVMTFGKSTADYLTRHGVTVDVIADAPTADQIVAALESYLGHFSQSR